MAARVETRSAPGPGMRERTRKATPYLLLAPGILWLLFFFIVNFSLREQSCQINPADYSSRFRADSSYVVFVPDVRVDFTVDVFEFI